MSQPQQQEQPPQQQPHQQPQQQQRQQQDQNHQQQQQQQQPHGTGISAAMSHSNHGHHHHYQEPRTGRIMDDVEKRVSALYKRIELSLRQPYSVQQARHDYQHLLIQMDLLQKALERDNTLHTSLGSKGKSASEVSAAAVKSKKNAEDHHLKMSHSLQTVLRSLSRQSRLS